MMRCTYSSNGLEVGRGLVFEVIWIRNLARCPRTLVVWILDKWCGPLPLVERVLDHGRLPFAASRHFVTLGVRNLWRNPVTIFFIVPVFGLICFWVCDHRGLVLEPVFRLLGFLVHNLIWLILVPIFWLGSGRVWDARLLNPIIRLLVLGVVDLFLWVD